METPTRDVTVGEFLNKAVVIRSRFKVVYDPKYNPIVVCFFLRDQLQHVHPEHFVVVDSQEIRVSGKFIYLMLAAEVHGAFVQVTFMNSRISFKVWRRSSEDSDFLIETAKLLRI